MNLCMISKKSTLHSIFQNFSENLLTKESARDIIAS